MDKKKLRNSKLLNMSKINLFYYKSKPNIGDAISPFIVSSICKREICYKSPKLTFYRYIIQLLKSIIYGKSINKNYIFPFQKCLLSVGSILDYSNSRCIIWGSGFRNYNSKYSGGEIFAVRGYLSRNKLPSKYRNVPVGDPAILLPLFIRPHNSSHYNKVALVPHYYDYDDFNRNYSAEYDILDVRTTNIQDFVNNLTSYVCILSSSLHGLIIAHTYGIPAIWIKKNNINSDEFKFHDYFSSVEIPQYNGFTDVDGILKDSNSWKAFFENHKDFSLPRVKITGLYNTLLDSFPFK